MSEKTLSHLPARMAGNHLTLVFVALFGVVSVGGPLFYLMQPLYIDEGLYLMIGSKITEGAVLYQDVIDHKPPGIFYLAAAASQLFGTPHLVLRLLTYAVTSLTGALVYWIGRTLRGRLAGMVASLIFLTGMYLPHFQGYYFLTEQYAIFCTVLAAALFMTSAVDRPWSDVLIGGTLAVGVLFNQIVFLFGLAVIIFFALRLCSPHRRTRDSVMATIWRLFAIGAGFALLVGVVLLYFGVTGRLVDLLTYTIYVPLTEYSPPFGLRGHIWMVLSYLPVWLPALGMVVVTARALSLGEVEETQLFLSVWLILISYPGLTTFAGDHRMLFVFPPAALLTVFAARRVYSLTRSQNQPNLADRLLSGRTAKLLGVCVIGLLVATAGFNAVYASLLFDDRISEQQATTDRIDNQVDGTVYMIPFEYYPTYFSENLEMPAMYVGGVYSEERAESVISDLQTGSHDYIVVKDYYIDDSGDVVARDYNIHPKLAAYINEEYEQRGETESFVILEQAD